MGGFQVNFLDFFKGDCCVHFAIEESIEAGEPIRMLDFGFIRESIDDFEERLDHSVSRPIEIRDNDFSTPDPFDLFIDGANMSLEDLKEMLPQNQPLLDWYDRVVLEL